MKQGTQTTKINQLVLGGFGIIIVLTGITNFVSKSLNDSLSKANDWIIHTNNVTASLISIKKILIDAETGQRGFIITNRERYLEPYIQAKEDISEVIKTSKEKISDNPEQVNRLSKIEALADKKFEELAETIALKKAGKEQETLSLILSDKGKNIMNEIRQRIDEMLQIEKQLLEQRKKKAEQIQNVANFIYWASLVCIIIVAIIVSFLIIVVLNHSLNLSLQSAFNFTEKIAAGDLTNKLDVYSNDVIGKFMTALKNMSHSLNMLIYKVQRSGIQVTSSSTQIAASGKQLEATITEQVAATNEVAAAAKEISATSTQLVKTMEEVAEMSQMTAKAATENQKDLLQMETTMQQLTEATNSIAARLGVISEKANNINNIVVTITKVADQTNLLSLNAAIEAEKAGEYGLGFAVVAREIRRLADQTAVATLDIEQMVKQMQSSVSTGVMEMDKFATEVGQSVEDVARISTQTTQIIEQVQQLTPRFEEVNQGMETQSQGAQQISEAMSQLSNTSMQTADSLRDINHAIAQLNQVSQGLSQEISRFKLKTEDFTPHYTESNQTISPGIA
ncbi:methyl-accepting chemotaxis protein [Mastigocoleus testarum]|uniref:Chemotaxis protein n=1 Tax=Mastigocoleus testarum BC008 TaxID=371196 RepID=A0A0V7ZV49_9CYAN|nr:CHASE3 domain-containing protein [Mastigocoleus testarum]KST68303.1 chemotaxis protein [Mastigocoleus testarum BC008]KST68315.1 chemotaxis protein [Mastigocoleus testarum BC008]